jgi:hypothetical protein
VVVEVETLVVLLELQGLVVEVLEDLEDLVLAETDVQLLVVVAVVVLVLVVEVLVVMEVVELLL